MINQLFYVFILYNRNRFRRKRVIDLFVLNTPKNNDLNLPNPNSLNLKSIKKNGKIILNAKNIITILQDRIAPDNRVKRFMENYFEN